MSVELNGIAHIQLTVNDPEACVPFWEKLCHFLEMKTLIKAEGVVYCIGSRTGILVRGAPPDKRDRRFDQDRHPRPPVARLVRVTRPPFIADPRHAAGGATA